MNILLTFNSNYFLPALVLLRSLLVNNRRCPEIVIYVMYLDLKEKEILRFSRSAEEWGNARAVFIRVPEDAFTDAPLHLKWISRETYYRLLAQEMLPETVFPDKPLTLPVIFALPLVLSKSMPAALKFVAVSEPLVEL